MQAHHISRKEIQLVSATLDIKDPTETIAVRVTRIRGNQTWVQYAQIAQRTAFLPLQALHAHYASADEVVVAQTEKSVLFALSIHIKQVLAPIVRLVYTFCLFS